MKLIAHRGNINGRNGERENSPDYIDEAIQVGYDVEIDVWIKENKLYLGHDEATYEITPEFLKKRQQYIWCHAKNLDALDYLLGNDYHCFFHDKDDYTITSKGVIWAYPGKTLNNNTVCVMPEWISLVLPRYDIYGICSDFIDHYKDCIFKDNL
jgi:hypothetical protein